MLWLKSWRRRRAIKSYLKSLGPLLFDDHGHSEAYTVSEVNQTVRRHGLDTEFSVYALAIYCPEVEFAGVFTGAVDAAGYHALRGDVTELVSADPTIAHLGEEIRPARAVAGASA